MISCGYRAIHRVVSSQDVPFRGPVAKPRVHDLTSRPRERRPVLCVPAADVEGAIKELHSIRGVLVVEIVDYPMELRVADLTDKPA